ncbi:MAG: hypothetical protein AB2A00_38670 [Myxococcota bacterium]
MRIVHEVAVRCPIITTGVDRWGLSILKVKCPLRREMPALDTCLECTAFRALHTPRGGAASLECVPADAPADLVDDVVGLPPVPEEVDPWLVETVLVERKRRG